MPRHVDLIEMIQQFSADPHGATKGVTSTPQTDRAIQWLLGEDPAIRWQALRDLVGAAERTVERERRKVARDGWGARLLARQDSEGTWAGGRPSDGGLYSPKWDLDDLHDAVAP